MCEWQHDNLKAPAFPRRRGREENLAVVLQKILVWESFGCGTLAPLAKATRLGPFPRYGPWDRQTFSVKVMKVLR